MLTLIVIIYLLLSLVCTFIIYSACVIASRNNELLHTEELTKLEHENERERRLGRVKSASDVAAKVANLFSPTSSLN